METIIILALVVSLATAAYFAAAAMRDGVRLLRRSRGTSAPKSFPQPAQENRHWALVTAAVETSISRAADMAALHERASHQLDAADYALHMLLGDLERVMSTTVASPLAARPIPAPAALRPQQTALAA